MKNDKKTKAKKNSSSKNKFEDILEIRRIIDNKEVDSVYYLSKKNKKGKNRMAGKTDKGVVKTKKRIRFGKRKVEPKDEKKIYSKTEKGKEPKKLDVKKPFLGFKPTKKVPKEGELKFKTQKPSKDERSTLFGKRKKELDIEDKKPVLELETEKKLPDERIEKQEIKVDTEKIKEPEDKKPFLGFKPTKKVPKEGELKFKTQKPSKDERSTLFGKRKKELDIEDKKPVLELETEKKLPDERIEKQEIKVDTEKIKEPEDKKPFLGFKPTKKVPKEGELKFKTQKPSKDERSTLFGKRKKELDIEDKKPVLELETEKKLPDERIEKQEIKVDTEKIKEPEDKKPFLGFKPTKKVPKEGELKFKTQKPSKDERSTLFGKRKKELDIEDKKPVLELETEKKLPDERIEKQEIKVDTEKIKEPEDKKQLLFGKTKKENKTSHPIQQIQKTEHITISKEDEIRNINKLKFSALEKLGLSNKEKWEELDLYPLIEPFAYALIIRRTDTLDNLYIVIELELNEEDAANHNLIIDVLRKFNVDTNELESKGKDKYLKEKIDQIMEDYTLTIDAKSRRKITYFLEKELLGLGKLEPLMKDPNIEDISCDNSDVPIFIYHRYFGSLMSSVKFADEDELSDLVVKLSQKCGKHISIANPMLDATMPDGSRIQMTLSSEVTTKGSTFTIRKFKENPFSPSDLIEFNTMSSEMMAYLWLAVEYGANALIAGGTASGKTSTLNALALYIPPESKIVTIEETREINLPHSNWIPGVARSGFGEVVGGKLTGEIDMYDLMKAALRQRPEYILVGEIRGRESYVLFQAMATGHTTYSTVHADSTKSLIHRLEGEPINIPRIMLQSLDVVCIQTISRVKNKRVRRCKQVIEIIDIDPSTKEILTNEVFSWDPVNDKFIYSGKSYVLERIRIQKDLSREEITDELRRRANLMEWMTNSNIKEFKKVASMVANYIDNPSKVMIKVNEENRRM